MVYPGWTAWHWVALAWGQLLGAYVAYLVYMRWRVQNLKKDLELNNINLSDTTGSHSHGNHNHPGTENHNQNNDKDNHG